MPWRNSSLGSDQPRFNPRAARVGLVASGASCFAETVVFDEFPTSGVIEAVDDAGVGSRFEAGATAGTLRSVCGGATAIIAPIV